MNCTPNQRMGLVALAVFVLDQLTKLAVLKYLGFYQERVVVDGFFKLVHWGNTGAAWSIFKDNNELLTITSLGALLMLFLARKHFDTSRRRGQMALGLLFGGVVGNITDRFIHGHVVDFLYFHLYTRSGELKSFPAFNVADSAICIGVAVLFLLSLQNGQELTEKGQGVAAADSKETPDPKAQ